MKTEGNNYLKFSGALRQILARPQIAEELKSSNTRGKTMEQLGIDEDMRVEIINLLMDMEGNPSSPESVKDAQAPANRQVFETDKDFLFESFNQLRTAYRTSITMSVVMFIIGISFLVIAAIRSFIDPQSIAITSVIGGIGIVQIVALFYRNPLNHIAGAVSNAQQAKISVMSYLLGITILNQQMKTNNNADLLLKNLTGLTEKALGQLQYYTEGNKVKNNHEGFSAGSNQSAEAGN